MQSSESVTFDTLNAGDTVYLGEVIEPLLRELGWSQARLARDLSVDPSIIGLWIHNSRPVPYGRLHALAEALDVAVDFLLANGRMLFHAPVPKSQRVYVRSPMPAHEVVIPSPIQETAPLPIPPSQVRLAWCTSDHGTGMYRRHHHGVLPMWGPGILAIEAVGA